MKLEHILFVGEQRSAKAIQMRVTWKDRRLASKQLHDAFDALNIDYSKFTFCNALEANATMISHAATNDIPIVGMGRIAQGVLGRMGVAHHPMTHPAARGSIRKKEAYAAHVRNVLNKINKEDQMKQKNHSNLKGKFIVIGWHGPNSSLGLEAMTYDAWSKEMLKNGGIFETFTEANEATVKSVRARTEKGIGSAHQPADHYIIQINSNPIPE